MIELGFAAKSIGWDNIICIFNKEYGEIEKFPFDIRFRRSFAYRIENAENKSRDRKLLAERLQQEISSIIKKQSAKDEIRNYIKEIIDKEVLSISNHLFKVIYGYKDQLSSKNIWELLSLSNQQLQEKLFEKKFLGFTVLKEWEGHLQYLRETMNQPFFVQHAETTFINAVVKIVKGLELVTSITKGDNLFKNAGIKDESYKIVDGSEMNADNPKDHYILIKKLDGEKGIVTDFGKVKQYNMDRLLIYQHISSEKFLNFIGCIHILIASLDLWIKSSGNNFIIGPS